MPHPAIEWRWERRYGHVWGRSSLDQQEPETAAETTSRGQLGLAPAR
ncbi:hypothetical protein [Rhizobium sp. IBUN]|nr:hypothetical protein [Rhizobium sp. IBUN]